MVWLSDNYIYRRSINITSPEPLPAGHFVNFTLPAAARNQGKIRDDFEGIEIVRDSDGFVANRAVSLQTDGSMNISFVLTSGAQNYYIYYGNLTLIDPPIRDATPFASYPVTHSYSSGEISYQRPGEDWSDGMTDVAHSRASFNGYMKDVRVVFASGSDRGIAQVRFLGDEWTDVDTFELAIGTKAHYLTASSSSDLQHLQIRNSGRSNLSSSDVVIELISIDVSLQHECELGLEEINLDAL